MEDWQLDNACLAAGLCTNGVDELLSNIEEALANGEITEYEAEVLYNDLTSTGKRRMQTPQNLIDLILDDKKTEAEKKLLYKATINALTSAVASNILLHISQARRNDMTGLDDPGVIPSLTGEPTLDERNAADLANAGDDFHTQTTNEAGHETPMRPIVIAEMCDGLRETLYDEFEGIVDLDPKTALYRNMKKAAADRPNYDQPMSLEFNLAYRIRMSGTIDEGRAKRVAEEDKVEIDFIREVMRKDNERVAKNLMAVAPEVIREAEGFDRHFDRSAFSSLPLDTQLRIGTKIASTINNEYQRLYGIKIRSGSLEVAQQCYVLKKNWEETKGWINEAEKLVSKTQNTRS